MRNMGGIVSYGSYIPYRRLKRAAIAAVLGTPAGKGEKAVGSFDGLVTGGFIFPAALHIIS